MSRRLRYSVFTLALMVSPAAFAIPEALHGRVIWTSGPDTLYVWTTQAWSMGYSAPLRRVRLAALRPPASQGQRSRLTIGLRRELLGQAVFVRLDPDIRAEEGRVYTKPWSTSRDARDILNHYGAFFE